MKSQFASKAPRHQRGAATIFITIVLLLAIALMGLYTNRGAIMEQRLASNEVRAKQSFAAANAGIDAALAFWRGGGNPLAVTGNPPVIGTLDRAGGGTELLPGTFLQLRGCHSGLPANPSRRNELRHTSD